MKVGNDTCYQDSNWVITDTRLEDASLSREDLSREDLGDSEDQPLAEGKPVRKC